jgi:HK97 family phage major capsid protein
MTSKEIREKRSKLMFDAHAIMTGADVTSEKRANVDKMLADSNDLLADAARMETLEAETRSVSAQPRGEIGVTAQTETRSIEERKEATAKALRNYLGGKSFEQRDLTVAGDGVLIPTGVADAKIAQKSFGSVYDLVNKLRTSTGEPMKAPLINDTTNGFVLNSVGITTTDPTLTAPTISIDDARSNPILLDVSLLQDSSFDLVNYVTGAIQTRYARTVANWITNGNASNVQGVSTVSTGVTASQTLTTKYADLVNLYAALDPAYSIGAAWLMSNATLASVLQIVDSNGRPLFLPFADGGVSGFAGTILGYPVKLNPYQPAVGVGNPYIQFGNFSEGYTFREVTPGVAVQRLNERYAELHRIGFVAFARVGGAVTDAGTHPIVTLTGK